MSVRFVQFAHTSNISDEWKPLPTAPVMSTTISLKNNPVEAARIESQVFRKDSVFAFAYKITSLVASDLIVVRWRVSQFITALSLSDSHIGNFTRSPLISLPIASYGSGGIAVSTPIVNNCVQFVLISPAKIMQVAVEIPNIDPSSNLPVVYSA